MIAKTIAYKNFLDEDETGTFYFHMSKGELVKQQMAAIDQRTESFQDKLEKIAKNLQGAELIAVVDEIILDGYGERSTDGKNFVKVRNGIRLAEEFMATGAYSELVVELCTKKDAMSDFINGLVPADLAAAVNKEVAATQSAQTPRERSEAQLSGFNQKQEAPKPTVQQIRTPAEVPVVIEGTAEPVLEATPLPTGDLSSLSREDLLKHVQSTGFNQYLK